MKVSQQPSTRPVCSHNSLGRVSFRAIKEKRDYLGRRKSASWMYMSRLAAQKEWAFLKVSPRLRNSFRLNGCKPPHLFFHPTLWQVLHEHQFPVPRPIDQARHCILMEFIDAYPLWVENLVDLLHLPCSWIMFLKASNRPGAFSWQTLLSADGSHRPIRACGTHTRGLQRVQHPHSQQRRRTRGDRFSSNG